MKKTVLTLFSFLVACTFTLAQSSDLEFETANAGSSPKFEWTDKVYDFGKIEQNKPVTAEFTFKNTGSAPLIISKVQPSCGCTVADYTKEPVAPGQSGYVKATYNAKGKGAFHKSVTITANVEGGAERLTIKGEVTTPAQ